MLSLLALAARPIRTVAAEDVWERVVWRYAHLGEVAGAPAGAEVEEEAEGEAGEVASPEGMSDPWWCLCVPCLAPWVAVSPCCDVMREEACEWCQRCAARGCIHLASDGVSLFAELLHRTP